MYLKNLLSMSDVWYFATKSHIAGQKQGLLYSCYGSGTEVSSQYWFVLAVFVIAFIFSVNMALLFFFDNL